MPELFIPYEDLLEDNPIKNRLYSVQLSAIMLYPGKKYEKRFKHYKARCLMDAVPYYMVEHSFSPEMAGGILVHSAISEFGYWHKFYESLYLSDVTKKGKGSVEKAGMRGYVVGGIFRLIYQWDFNLNEAVHKYFKRLKPKEKEELVSEENIIKNIWGPLKSVVHIWAAMTKFHYPDDESDYFALDKITPNEDVDKLYGGLLGLIDLANGYYEVAIEKDARFRDTNKMLIDKKTAWKIIT